MPLLIDRMIAGHIENLNDLLRGGMYKSKDHFIQSLKSLHVLTIDDLTEGLPPLGKDMPNALDALEEQEGRISIRPPFREMWIEYGIPKHLDYSHTRAGFLIVQFDLPYQELILEKFKEEGLTSSVPQDICDNTTKIMGSLMFILQGNPIFLGSHFIGLDEAHTMTGFHHTTHSDYWVKGGLTPRQISIWSSAFSVIHLIPVVQALGRLNCKNITTEQHTPPPKLVKKHKRKNNLGLVDYHTLKIDLGKTATPAQDAKPNQGDHNRVHICRGHYVTYTAERPLFGKITGTFWKSAHVRGRGKGIVLKDYQVKGEKSK